jgi:putative sterol carrier protein
MLDDKSLPSTDEVMHMLPDRFRSKYAGKMTTSVQFLLEGEDGGQWYMTIANGECKVGQGVHPDPEATVTMDSSDFVGINTGTVSAVDTFWSGRIQIDGSIDVVLALPPVMNWR